METTPVLRAALVSTALSMVLAACGRSANPDGSATAPIAAKPDVVITYDGVRRTCSVALYAEPQGSAVACGDVVPFVRDELRVPSGSIYGIRRIPVVDDAELSKAVANMNAAGYRFIGGSHAE